MRCRGDGALHPGALGADRPATLPPLRLADFGLVKMLGECDYAHNLDGAGTVTHLAPEVLTPNSKVRAARALGNGRLLRLRPAPP